MSLLGVADKPTGIRRRFCKKRNEYWTDELPTEEKRGLPARSQPSKKQPGPHSSELVRSASGRVSRASPVHTAVRNCTRDEGGPFEAGSQVLASNHRKLLSSKAMVVSVAETSGRDPVRHG